MPRARTACPCTSCAHHHGPCPAITTRGRCHDCSQAAEQARGTATQRGYGRRHRTRFRPAVLARHPICVCTDTTHGHGPRCTAPSTVADHHPLSRRQLVTLGHDPDDPRHGRGLCQPCHDKHTAVAQPGGWNRG